MSRVYGTCKRVGGEAFHDLRVKFDDAQLGAMNVFVRLEKGRLGFRAVKDSQRSENTRDCSKGR